MKSTIDSTPKKNVNNNLNSFNNDEIDAILKSYFLDVENKRKAIKSHLDRSLSTFSARSLSILASVPRALHSLTLGEFQDKFNGDLVRAVRGEGVKDATQDLESKDREEEWELARKRKRAIPSNDLSPSSPPDQSTNTKKSSRKNTRSKTIKSSNNNRSRYNNSSTRSTRSKSKVKETDILDHSTSSIPTSSFNPQLNDDLPDESLIENQVLNSLNNNTYSSNKTITQSNLKKRPSITVLNSNSNNFSPISSLNNNNNSNKTHYLHDSATLFIPLPDGTKLAVDPARAQPEELNKLEGISDEMRLIVKNEIERRMKDLIGLIDRWRT